MIDIGFEFQLEMRGSYYFTRTPLESYRMVAELTFRARKVGRFLHDKAFAVTGTLHAAGLADGADLHGEFVVKTFRNRRFMSDLTFRSNENKLIRFYGEQDLVPVALIDSLTTLSATLYEPDGEELGRAELRFNIRRGWKPLVRSLRPIVEG